MEGVLLLEKLNREFNEIKNEKEIDANFLKNVFEFIEIDPTVFYESLLQIFINNYADIFIQLDTKIENIESIYNEKIAVFNSFKPKKFLENILEFNDSMIDNELNKIKPFRERVNDLESKYDMLGYQSDLDEYILKKIERNLELAKKEYKAQQKEVNVAYSIKEKRVKEYIYILNVDFKKFILKLNYLKNMVGSFNKPIKESIPLEDRVFKEPTFISKAYEVLVTQEFIENIDWHSFNSQFDDINSKLSLVKQTKVNNYISYIINILKDHVYESKRDFWEGKMLEHFKIETNYYDRKKNVAEDGANRKDKHDKIDEVLK